MRIELTTSSLPRKRSTPELHWRSLSGRRGSNPRPLAWKANALPTELLPQFLWKHAPALVCRHFPTKWWEKMDSNHRRYKPADLQSAPFGHSGILPFFACHRDKSPKAERPDKQDTKFSIFPFEENFKSSKELLSRWRESNPRPRDYKSRALAN